MPFDPLKLCGATIGAQVLQRARTPEWFTELAGELPANKHVADWLYAHGFVAHGERWACDARGLKALRPDEISFKRQIR